MYIKGQYINVCIYIGNLGKLYDTHTHTHLGNLGKLHDAIREREYAAAIINVCVFI